MARRPVNFTFTVTSLSLEKDSLDEICLDLVAELGGEGLLLAFADDGVIWGRVQTGKLTLSHDAYPNVSPPLRKETLLQLHLFNDQGEARIWRTSHGLRTALIRDEPSQQADAMEETYLLWGTHYISSQGGFTLVSEGSRGFRHAVPLSLGKNQFRSNKAHPLKLKVRHYLTYDNTGSAVIALTRLLDLGGN